MEEKFDELRNELELYTVEKLTALFKEEGSALLRRGIISRKVSSLNFIVSTIPSETVKAVFESEVNDFLETLLGLQDRNKEPQTSFSEKEQALLEKFLLLFKINFEAVQTYMNNYIKNKGDYLTPSIEKVYKTALELHTKAVARDVQQPHTSP